MKQLVIRKAKDCDRCGLCEHRTQVVFGEGSYGRGIMGIGEAPGGHEDEKGRVFIGRAGRKLNRWFKTIGLTRKKDFFLTNLVRCRPPGNRNPEPKEIAQCQKWLRMEFRRVKPWLVIPIGGFAAKTVLNNPKFSILAGAGIIYPRMLYHLGYHTSDFVVVYPLIHPAYILRNPSAEDRVLDDLERLRDEVLALEP